MERKKGWLTSGAFAALCGTTKETLRHYKDIGLLSPARQGDNSYFYYDVEQFYDFYAISIFRQTGTPLEEVRRCLLARTPLRRWHCCGSSGAAWRRSGRGWSIWISCCPAPCTAWSLSRGRT